MATIEDIRKRQQKKLEQDYEEEYQVKRLNKIVSRLESTIKYDADKGETETYTFIDKDKEIYASKVASIFKERGFQVTLEQSSIGQMKLTIAWGDKHIKGKNYYTILEIELSKKNEKLEKELEELKRTFNDRLEAELAQIYAPPGSGNGGGGVGYLTSKNHFEDMGPVDKKPNKQSKKKKNFSFRFH